MRAASKKTEIIYVTSASVSGAALYSRCLCDAIWRKGFALHAVVPENFEYFADMLAHGQNVSADLPPIRWKGPLGSIALIAAHWYRMLNRMRQISANQSSARIVHFNFPAQGPFAVVPVVLAKCMGFRVIVTVHDINPNRFMLPRFLRRVELFLHDRSHTKADYLIVHFQRARQILADEKHFDAGRIAVIPHGRFAEETEERRQDGIHDGPLNFLVFGSLRENKNIAAIAQAFLDTFSSNEPAVLTIAGYPANTSLLAELEALAARSDRRIRLNARWIENEETRRLFQSADCAILAYAETFQSASGVAALSLSSGVPLIATRVGGISEIPSPDRMAILMETASPDELKKALRKAFTLERQTLHRMGEAGRAYAREHLSWNAIADKHIALYERAGSE
ncbi:MAG TPA: glycosyltransferase family 4 protein [Rhizomicrobium sp.]|jgi:glycosyltransferase involved in cell wall biosynthesis|nr:glycosyltransferase family 4 protein [Rhizomicrobium sp.]